MITENKENPTKLYYVSWNGCGATYTRCFESNEKREVFIKTLLNPKCKFNTWENEIRQ